MVTSTNSSFPSGADFPANRSGRLCRTKSPRVTIPPTTAQTDDIRPDRSTRRNGPTKSSPATRKIVSVRRYSDRNPRFTSANAHFRVAGSTSELSTTAAIATHTQNGAHIKIKRTRHGSLSFWNKAASCLRPPDGQCFRPKSVA